MKNISLVKVLSRIIDNICQPYDLLLVLLVYVHLVQPGKGWTAQLVGMAQGSNHQNTLKCIKTNYWQWP